MESFVFTCKHRQGQYLLDAGRVRFTDNTFVTSDKQLAEKIRELPEFGKDIFEGAAAVKQSNVVQGARSSFNHPDIPESSKEDYIRLGFLQGKILNGDGTFRKNASEEEVNEFKTLKTKLGV